MNLAPVVITVYNRFDSLQNAINALLTNKECPQTELYIISDYAYRKEDEEIIAQIRDYIINIKGFKKIEGLFWEKNKGSFQSAQDGLKYVYSQHDRLIFFEDDILVSNRFLEYMNAALELYKDDKRILSIASSVAHKPIAPKNYPYDVFLVKMYSPWGSGMWKDRFEAIDWDMEGVQDFLKDKKQLKAFNAISRHMLPLLLHMLETNSKYGDVMTCYHMFKKNLYTLYPIKPLSVNKGHDGRGEHCVVEEDWQNQPLEQDFCPKLVRDIAYDEKIAKNYYKFFYDYKRDFLTPLLQALRIYKPIHYVYKKLKYSKVKNARS